MVAKSDDSNLQRRLFKIFDQEFCVALTNAKSNLKMYVHRSKFKFLSQNFEKIFLEVFINSTFSIFGKCLSRGSQVHRIRLS